MEQTPSPSSFLKLGLHHTLGEVIAIARAAWSMLATPSAFAATYISDRGDDRFFAAIRFYLGIFSIAFVFILLASRFQFYEGQSEIRELIKLSFKFALGALVAYLLILLTGPRLRFYGLAQIVLYVFGVYVAVDAAVSFPVHYASYLIESGGPSKVVDVFATEFEGCLSEDSLLYWTIRGDDLQFYLSADQWRPSDWYAWGIQNRMYLVVVPFLFLFAGIVRQRFGGKFIILALIAAIGFIAAEETTEFAEAKIRERIAVASDCTGRIQAEIPKKYSALFIASQLKYKLNNELKRALNHDRAPALTLRGQDFVWLGQMEAESQIGERRYVAQLETRFKGLYCSEDSYWQMMRQINSKFAVLVAHWRDDSFVYSRVFQPQGCN